MTKFTSNGSRWLCSSYRSMSQIKLLTPGKWWLKIEKKICSTNMGFNFHCSHIFLLQFILIVGVNVSSSGCFFCLFVLKPVSFCSTGSFWAFFLMKREMLTVSFSPPVAKDFEHHLVWELGDRGALPFLVGLQPATDPAAAPSLLLVLPHSEDSVPSHLQRKSESTPNSSMF